MKKLLALSVISLAFSQANADYTITDVYFDADQPAGENPAGVFSATTGNSAFLANPGFVDNEFQDSFTFNDIATGLTVTVYESSVDLQATAVPSTLSGLPSNSSVQFEDAADATGNGTGQGGANSEAWGFDTGATTGGANGALVFTFANEKVTQFGIDTFDFEGSAAGTEAVVAVYNQNGDLVKSESYNFAENGGDGNFRFFGIESTMGEGIGAVAFIIGDDDVAGNGYTERVAAADLFVTVEEVPVPAAIWLFGSSLVGLLLTGRKK